MRRPQAKADGKRLVDLAKETVERLEEEVAEDSSALERLLKAEQQQQLQQGEQILSTDSSVIVIQTQGQQRLQQLGKQESSTGSSNDCKFGERNMQSSVADKSSG